jgi:hypothetical protein
MKFWQRRREHKLYKQWTEHAKLPPEAISHPELSTDMKMGAEEESRSYRFRVKIRDAVEKVLRLK